MAGFDIPLRRWSPSPNTRCLGLIVFAMQKINTMLLYTLCSWLMGTSLFVELHRSLEK